MVDRCKASAPSNSQTQRSRAVQRLAPALAALITGFVVGIANNWSTNLPLGLIAGATLQAERATGLIASAVLIAVDLGPNLLRDRLPGHDSVVDRATQREAGCERMGLSSR